jgi:hypothetical protein
MTPTLLRLFQSHVQEQCLTVLRVYPLVESRRVDDVFFGLPVLLNAAANISKLLWGGGRRSRATARRRAPLRASLQVSDSSALRSTAMRNRFEHMDERLEEWDAKSRRHVYIDRNVGPVQAVIAGVDAGDFFRNYDPETGMVIFWGDTFDVRAIVAEVQRILPLATDALDHGDQPSPT